MLKVPIALCKLQGVNVKLLMANARGTGPIAKCKSQIDSCDFEVPRANCKLQGVRGQEFHTRGANINQKHTHFRKSKASIVRVSSSKHELQLFWCKFPMANARGPRARGQLQITNWDCKLRIAKGKLQGARGKGFHTRYTKIV